MISSCPNYLFLIYLLIHAFWCHFCTIWWYLVGDMCSFNYPNISILSCSCCVSEIFFSTATHRLSLKYSNSITTYIPYTKSIGVYFIKVLWVVMLAHNTIGLLSSKESILIENNMVNPRTNIMLNSSITPLVIGWYGVLWWVWLIMNSFISATTMPSIKCYP